MKKKIYIAGGCFWGVNEYYSRLKGVLSVLSGYANGTKDNPTYQEVKSHQFHHVETVEIVYDDSLISLETILLHFLRFVDPYSINKQGKDEGTQYRSGVYYTDLLDAITAREAINSRVGINNKIEVKKLNNFFKAEEYHQDYLKKNPTGYCHVNLDLIKDEEKKR